MANYSRYTNEQLQQQTLDVKISPQDRAAIHEEMNRRAVLAEEKAKPWAPGYGRAFPWRRCLSFYMLYQSSQHVLKIGNSFYKHPEWILNWQVALSVVVTALTIYVWYLVMQRFRRGFVLGIGVYLLQIPIIVTANFAWIYGYPQILNAGLLKLTNGQWQVKLSGDFGVSALQLPEAVYSVGVNIPAVLIFLYLIKSLDALNKKKLEGNPMPIPVPGL